MMKLYPSIMLLTTLVAQSQIQAWSSHTNPEMEQHPKPACVDNRSGLVELDYLFWKPYQEDMHYAVRTKQSTESGTIDLKVRPKSPEYDLSSGVRLGVGVYTSDVWDVKLRGTYLYSDNTEEQHAIGSSTDALFPSVFPFLQGAAGNQTKSYWRLNFGIGDLTLGRTTTLSPKFNVRPFIGIRSVFMRQLFKNQFDAVAGASIVPGAFRNTSNVWGIGPRAGLDSTYYFADHWSFQGGLSGSLVLGNFRARQKLLGFNGADHLKVHVKDSSAMIRANLDGYLGIGWDMYFNNNNNRVYVAILCDTSYWFGINQFMDLNVNSATLPVSGSVGVDKRHGDLAFFGGTVHFQMDF